jgi:enamine deaminase RidA (YjgF/YER057c/UK114 family)
MANGFNPQGVWHPRGRGFNVGVVQHDGHVIHFTGQVAWNENEEIVGLGDVAAQTRQCFENIKTVLAAIGGTLVDLVAVTTYFTDRAQLPLIQQVRAEYLDQDIAPTSTSVMVAGLGHPDFLVELAPIAVVPHSRFREPS